MQDLDLSIFELISSHSRANFSLFDLGADGGSARRLKSASAFPPSSLRNVNLLFLRMGNLISGDGAERETLPHEVAMAILSHLDWSSRGRSVRALSPPRLHHCCALSLPAVTTQPRVSSDLSLHTVCSWASPRNTHVAAAASHPQRLATAAASHHQH